jgi:hypothetical protein
MARKRNHPSQGAKEIANVRNLVLAWRMAREASRSARWVLRLRWNNERKRHRAFWNAR